MPTSRTSGEVELDAGPGADLRDADLRGASLVRRDLTGAALEGALIRGTSLRGAALEGANAAGSTWDHVDAAGADLGGVTLSDAVVTMTSFDGARLAGTDLQGATLSHVRMDSADLTGARLRGTVTVDVSLRDATLAGVEDVSRCREFVVELLRPVAGEDPGRLLLLGALAGERRWCDEEWLARLAEDPETLAAVRAHARLHPASGISEALMPVRGG